MGNGGEKKRFSSSSMKLVLFMVPLIVVSGFVAILGSKSPWLWSFSSTTSAITTVSSYSSSYFHENINNTTAAEVIRGEGVIVSSDDDEGLPYRLVVADGGRGGGGGGDGHNNIVEEENSGAENFTILRPPSASASSPMRETKENGGLNDSMNNGPPIQMDISTMKNESYGGAMKARVQREYTNLEKLEVGLRRARTSIREAKNGSQLQDPDYMPVGPMYWNANAFHRSYLEMEKQFKIFVYEEGEPPIFHNGPCKSIYSMEGNFIHMLEVDKQFRTRDPEKAHVYFLPFSVAMLVQFVYERDSHSFRPIRQTVVDYLNVISGKYPYWNRSLAADHFMLACHDWGPETSYSNPYLGKNAIRVLCNANTSEGFNPSKDASFPEINLLTGRTLGFLGGPSPSRRSILAFFAGGLHGPIRPVLLEQWENKDEDIKVHQYLPKGVSYYETMRNTKYCLCPSGYEVASPRVVEALYTGCVPVLISDHYVPPFSDILNWKSFSVEVPVKDIPNLKTILMGISSRQYIRLQRRGAQVRKHFEVNSPPKRYDVYHMILHSVWLRRMNVRVQD